MYNLKTLFFFLSLISISLQICHYARDPLPSAGSCICQQAAYSDNGICKLCPNNSYQSSGSATSVSQCDSCQGNSFYLITKATQLSSAICSNCPNNSMNQNMLSTDTQDISVCSYCGSDTYILIPAVQGQPAVCVLCPNNSTTKQGIAKIPGISQCNTCKPGFYISYPATDTQPAICLPCPANTTNQYMYSNPKNNISDCTLCTKGFYQTSQYNAPLTCQKCPLNSTSNGISQIRSIDLCYCDVNYFMIADSKANISAPTCIPCPNGSGTLTRAFQIEDQSYCDICQAGYYMIQSYQDSTSGSPAKAAQCQKCPNNSFSNPGTSTSLSSCSLCFLNYYMTAASKISNEASCTICPDNTGTMAPQSQPGDSTQCNICLPGYYMTSPFQIDKTAICQQCPKGSYSNVGVNTACYCYDINASWSTVNKTCQCNSGYGGIPGTFEGDPSGCILCPEGTYSSSGQCVPCPAGQYSDTTGNTQCQKCQANLYSQGIGNQKCSSCPNNTTILPDQTGCSCNDISSVFLNSICACPDGFTGTPSNSSSQQGCTPCPSGQYSNSQTFGKCTYCAKGDYQPQIGTSLSLQICHYAVQTRPMNNGPCQCVKQSYLNNSNCQYCPNNAISSTGGATQVTQCNTCSDRWFYMSQKATDSAPAICTNCPNNSISNVYQPSDVQDVSICSSCGNDSYIDTAAVQGSSAVCVLCPNNSATLYGISSQGILSCGYCKPGYYISQPGTSSQAAVCSACPANTTNQYANGSAKNNNASDCSMCQQGYYQISQNGAPLVCQKCPANTTTNGRVQVTSVSFCICDVNQYMTATSQSQAQTCVSCPNGSGTMYPPNEVGDESYCDICQAGYYMVQPYQDSAGGSPAKAAQCQKCPNNSFSNAGAYTSVSSCSLCSLNYYMTAASTQSTQASCTICPDNTATMAPQSQPGDSTQCNICLAGYFMTVPFQFGKKAQCQQCPSGSNSNSGYNTACFCYDVNASWSTSSKTCQCNPGYGVSWSVGNNQCICTANFYGDATQATSSDKQKCKACPNNSTSKAGGAKTQNDCSTASAQQDSIHSYSSIVKISLSTFFFLILLL
ncbi:hypothetical protein ABPG74_002084 [Tetrahymena malaccensis]